MREKNNEKQFELNNFLAHMELLAIYFSLSCAGWLVTLGMIFVCKKLHFTGILDSRLCFHAGLKMDYEVRDCRNKLARIHCVWRLHSQLHLNYYDC